MARVRGLGGWRRGLGRGRGRAGRFRGRPHELSVLEDDRTTHHRVFQIHAPLLGAAHVAQEVREVRPVELARERRQAAREIDVPDDRHPATDDDLAGAGEGAVAAVLGREVHDDRPRTHRGHHLLRDERRRGLSGDEGRRDDDVDVLGLPEEEGHLRGDELRAHLLRVATAAAAVLLDLDLQELRAHALHLLAHLRAGVEPSHDCAEAPRSADRREPGDPGADHEHLRGRHLARGRHLPGEEPTVKARGLDDRAVTGDVGHRAQRVDLLGPRDPRHLVHRDDRRLARRQSLDELLALGRPEEADEHAVLAQRVHLVAAVGARLGGLDLEHEVALRPHRTRARCDRGAGRRIGRVVERSPESRPRLDRDLEAELPQPSDGVRGGRHAALSWPYFLGYSDSHALQARADSTPRPVSMHLAPTCRPATPCPPRAPAARPPRTHGTLHLPATPNAGESLEPRDPRERGGAVAGGLSAQSRPVVRDTPERARRRREASQNAVVSRANGLSCLGP